jgi:hypothetical protein
VSVKHLDLAHNQISSWATDPETDGNCYGFQESTSGLCGTPEPRHRANILSLLHLFANQCFGSGSVGSICFWASQIIIQLYVYGS